MKNSIKISLLLLFITVHQHSVSAQMRKENLTELIVDRDRVIPLKDLGADRIGVVASDTTKYTAFVDQLGRYAEIVSLNFDGYAERTKSFNTIIVVGTTLELSQERLDMLSQSALNGKKVVICEFDEVGYLPSPQFGLRVVHLKTRGKAELQQVNMAMSIFGGVPITNGIHKRELLRIQYGYEELSGLDLKTMARKIDAIAAQAISEKAAPGMVVMALKDGRVIFEKAYGHHTYEKRRAMQVGDIFDLASISKIVATTPVAMHLYEAGVIDLDSTIGHYLYKAKASNKANTTLRTVLLHEGGFIPFIPFYRSLKPDDMQKYESVTHQVRVSDHAYLRNNYYEDVMWPTMLHSPIKNAGRYVYSDISMYVMKEIVENETHVPIDQYVSKMLYGRIGMKTTGFNPTRNISKSRIVPTQDDTVFRKELLQGFVHDEGAAMAGGVAGHAGLFASANDLAIYGQLLLNRGTYGGVRYFMPETVDLFTSRQSRTSRRGLGFDRYDVDSKSGYPSRLANESVYGHTGYTGTAIWIDPRNQLVYIFLSNRVHPQVSSKLLDLHIRSRIQDAIYEAINP